MKKILSNLLIGSLAFSFTGCMQEFEPQNSTVTINQAADAPGSYDNFVSSIYATWSGQFLYGGVSNTYPYDYGYTSFYIMRDVMGNDLVANYTGSWYSTWYGCGTGLGPTYAVCQLPWTVYYSWIKDCNTVIQMAGEEPEADRITGAGIAHAMRAMYYMELAQMFAQKTYALDQNAITVPIVTEQTTAEEATKNPRATNSDMWAFIIDDLNIAEQYLAGYTRPDIYSPDITVVYGLKARAYLVMADWANAEKYAKMAQNGYTLTTNAQYTSRENGFNTPTGSWMLGTKFKSTDPCILNNDADSSWGSIMCLEANGSECGYASDYGQQITIDRHLYETIPATDIRKSVFVDFAIDNLSKADQIKALEAYSDYPEWIKASAEANSENKGAVGGLSLKFRTAGGTEGHYNQYIGSLVSVPMMRVEEMHPTEAHADGLHNEGRGIALLTSFATIRDPQYVYGTHNEAYGNTSTSPFQNEVWWQRRVELWGEGFATLDIKRLNKGIIRSYAGTNHLEDYRWNTTTPPEWMNLCIVQTESNYNTALINNPTPIRPSSDSPEYQF